MSYYNYASLFPAGQAQDRVRGSKITSQAPELSTIDEVYTSESWIIRIYKVKPLDNIGRDHQSAAAFEKGRKKKTKTTTGKKGVARVLRED